METKNVNSEDNKKYFLCECCKRDIICNRIRGHFTSMGHKNNRQKHCSSMSPKEIIEFEKNEKAQVLAETEKSMKHIQEQEKEYNRTYIKAHKEQLKQYFKQHYEAHKSEKYYCDCCNCEVVLLHKARHLRTSKHLSHEHQQPKQ